MLPVEAQMTALAPCSTAFDTAMVIPRSLNEPVGFMPSNLTQTLGSRAARQRVGREQRGAALTEGDDRSRVGDVQPVGEFTEDSAPLISH